MIYGKSITEKAYAKINLFLDVTGKRDDGFHDILSVMQSISLCDIITMSLEKYSGDHLTCNIDSIPTDGSNLVIKAVNAFREHTGYDFGSKIHLEKNIPFSAGLAGGSSDAAAILRILCSLTGNDICTEKMLDIAAAIGADVPFCFVGGTAMCEGKGEIVTPLDPCSELHLVVAIKGEGVSTPYAYSMLDNRYGDFSNGRERKKANDLIISLRNGDSKALVNGLYNIFETVIEKDRPEIVNIKNIMVNHGAQKALMSGSGPSVFGIFSNKNSAIETAHALKKYGASA
ncbi:MAG: 4-(cytidine 5'-diphospho)-2-C-methyl-D-erythritol kinase, partial [Clostridia bacterium]|nr:4-(cytidine 5'-diphospho)-2-C-methyl-D-erythritol kinase [Clostridia bacterium]